MRSRRGRSGVSTGTAVTLIFLALVAGGCALLFPKLLGRVDLRVNPQQVGVALENSWKALGDSVLRAPTAPPASPMAAALPADTAVPTQAPTVPAVQRLSITAAGEIAINRNVQAACTTDAGYMFPFLFAQISARLTGDINLATLQNIVAPDAPLSDVNMPAAAVTALASAGFNVLSTGFYGALDAGVAGLQSTLDAMTLNTILPYGTYLSPEQRNRVVTKDVNGVTVAFLSFQGELSAEGKKATTKQEQSFVFAPLTLPAVTAEISAARAAGAKIVVVSLCWGREGDAAPTKLQTELARGIAAAGADIIIGSNPGVLQPVEILTSTREDGTQRQTLCAYSLGSLIDSDRQSRAVISSAMLHMNLRYNLATDALTFETITYSPVYIWRGSSGGKTTYQPVIAGALPPEGMDADQQGVMGRALADIRAVFENSLIQER